MYVLNDTTERGTVKVISPKPTTHICDVCLKHHEHAIHLAVGSAVKYYCSLDCLKSRNSTH